MIAPLATSEPAIWRHGELGAGRRCLAEETAIALTYDRATYAVMMATPADLEDFAVGFSLNEGIIATASEIETLELVEQPLGIELRMTLGAARGDALIARRRHLTGATGCGLCGMESLEAAMHVPKTVDAGPRIAAASLAAAMAGLAPAQKLNRQTRAVHAAGFWDPARGVVAVREDVGRHNALDKLAGALARAGIAAASGAVLLTSRVSVEMVQKSAAMGAPVIAAISAPTALAQRVAEAAGITLVAVVRDDGFEVFTRPDRIDLPMAAHVA